MFGNNINGPYMSPNTSFSPMMRSTPIMGMSSPMMGLNNSQMLGAVPRRGGFLSNLLGLGNRSQIGAFAGTRSFNFGNLLNNASKALGVVKEAIPIVKEVGPMMGNMRSMLKLASVFKDETDIVTTPQTNNSRVKEAKIEQKESDTTPSTTITLTNNNEPNFFL